ncbi:MAG TPA: hypothetical protein EYQ26_03810 [Rhodospirillales bacterium]|nr:hypothetical protein [Rhodospirillales bacterium]
MITKFKKLFITCNERHISPRIKLLLTTILFLAMITPLISLSAQTSNTKRQGIVAVVNNEIISKYDFINRVKLVIFLSKLPNDKKTIKRISSQILHGLINDKLKLQEARKLGINVKQTELKAAITEIEKMNGLAEGRMRVLMKKKGINFSSFQLQVEAQTAWSKAVVKQVLSANRISDEAVDEAIATIELNKGKPEYNVAEIFIPFEAGKSTEKARQIAMRLYSQIQQGANFSALARAFSQSASAGKGGNLGWIRNEQIEQNLSNIMTKMRKNSTSEPMKGESGYYVLNLIDKRKSLGVSTEKIKITLEQLFLPLRINSSENETKVITEQAEDISSSIKTCSALNQKGKELGSRQSGTLEVNDITQLPTNIRTIVQKNDLFKASKPIRTGSGILIIMVCKRSGGGTLKNIRAKIKSMLLQKRAVLTDRSMLRNIRRTAFLDIRQ